MDRKQEETEVPEYRPPTTIDSEGSFNIDLDSLFGSRIDSVFKVINFPFDSESVFEFPAGRRWWQG